MTRPLSLVASAEVTGRMVYVELAAFERLGRAARAVPRPDLAAFYAGASLAHGFRARLLEGHLPVSVGLPGPADLVASPGPDLEAALALVAPGADPGADATPPPADGPEDRLEALLLALYPAMLAAYDERLSLASPASDPPLARTLRRVRDDLAAVAAEGRLLLSAPAAAGAGTCRARCADLLARAPVFGPLGPAGPPQAARPARTRAHPPKGGA